MTPDPSPPLDESFLSFLVDCDEALAEDRPLPALPAEVRSTELQPRVEASLDCLRLLRRTLWATPEPVASRSNAAPFGLGGDFGATHLGRFRIRQELGRGGFGIVFLAEDPLLDRLVALKVPRPETLNDAGLRQRFLQEARAAAGLDHPNLVPVYEAGDLGPVCYIVSAYCPGPNLAAWLKEHQPVAPAVAAEVVAALAEAVEHAHRRGIFHRDLKPSNVLMTPGPPEQAGLIPRLTDFGLAKLLDAEIDQTTSGVVLGTPPYMAPEQAAGWSEEVGAATDVYALGVILYEMLTGRLPFLGESVLLTLDQIRTAQPESPRRLAAGMPRSLEVVSLKCLRKDPAQRYATAAELADDLRRFLAGEPVQARPLGVREWLWNWCRRPERIRDAAAVCSVTAALDVGSCSAGVVLVLAGALIIPQPIVGVCYLLGFIVVFGSLFIWTAARAVARNVTALRLGVVLPFALMAYQLGGGAGYIPTGGIANAHGDPAAWQAQIALLAALNLLQSVSFVIALVAYRANRHIPGFLPRRQSIPS